MRVALPVWLVYVGSMSYFGVVSNISLRPPGIFYILLPVLVFVGLVLVRSEVGGTAARSFPIWLLLLVPVYRIGVELFLHQLWHEGLVPRMLTFQGANADIWVGLSAPAVAWFSTRGRTGLQVALVWNWLGLLSLTNIALRFAMTAPGPLHVLNVEWPNMAAGTFPYTFIPGFLAPLAVSLHVLAIRAIRTRLRVDAAILGLHTSSISSSAF